MAKKAKKKVAKKKVAKKAARAVKKKTGPGKRKREAALAVSNRSGFDSGEDTAAMTVGDKLFQDGLARLRDERKALAGGILQHRYNIGALGMDVVTSSKSKDNKLANKYGRHTVNDLANGLDESDSTMYNCLKFARMITPEQLAHLKEHQWPWRAVISLLSVEDKKDRLKKQEEFEANPEMDGEKFKAVCEAHNKEQAATGARKEKRGRPTLLTPIKTCDTVCSQMNTQICPDFLSAVQEIGKTRDEIPDDRLAKVGEHVDSIRTHFRGLRAWMDKIDKELDGASL